MPDETSREPEQPVPPVPGSERRLSESRQSVSREPRQPIGIAWHVLPISSSLRTLPRNRQSRPLAAGSSHKSATVRSPAYPSSSSPPERRLPLSSPRQSRCGPLRRAQRPSPRRRSPRLAQEDKRGERRRGDGR